MVSETVSASDTIVGRRRERAELADILASRRPELLALYGRRRVGKTYLIREFFRHRGLFFEVAGLADGAKAQQLRLFAESLSEAFSPGVARASPASWHDAFQELQAEVARVPRSGKKIVLFFDELPWLATPRSGFLAEFEHFWNRYASQNKRLIVIVCGSAASWMIDKFVHARGGLHNRLTRLMRLLPFTLPEARAYLQTHAPGLSRDEVVELYMALGGIPYYLRLVEGRRSAAQNIDRMCFDRAGPLRTEFDDVFASLFRNGDEHRRLIEALGKRRAGVPLKDALVEADIPSGGGARRIVTALEEAGFITSAVPFGRTARDRLVRVSDPFSLFVLRWLRPGPRKDWAQVRGTPRWRTWAGLAFETLILEHVDLLKEALGIRGVATEASPWAYRGGGPKDPGCQIDLLLDRADNLISICEMKYTEQPFTVTRRYADELRGKLAIFRGRTKTRKALRLVLISAHGVVANEAARSVDEIITLDDVLQ